MVLVATPASKVCAWLTRSSTRCYLAQNHSDDDRRKLATALMSNPIHRSHKSRLTYVPYSSPSAPQQTRSIRWVLNFYSTTTTLGHLNPLGPQSNEDTMKGPSHHRRLIFYRDFRSRFQVSRFPDLDSETRKPFGHKYVFLMFPTTTCLSPVTSATTRTKMRTDQPTTHKCRDEEFTYLGECHDEIGE